MNTDRQGKTLWEMLQERLRGTGNGTGITFWNPLALTVGSPMLVPFANGPEFAGHDFTVQEIREYTRRIGGQDFRFTDYALRGVSTRSFDTADTLAVRLRVVPNAAGSHDSLLLRLYDEFAFAEDFLAVLKDTTRVLELTDDASGAHETFTRINDLLDSFEAAVLVVAETSADGRGVSKQSTGLKVEYWDYWRDVDIGAGKTAKEFLFAEMNSETGWFELWRGREFFS